MRYLVHPLVAQVLADALKHHRLAGLAATAAFGPFGFHHYEWNAVDVTHHIRRAMVRTLRGQHLQFFGHIPAVGGGVGPVDHRNRGLVFLAVGHELGDRDAQRELGIQPFVGSQQPFRQAQTGQLAHDLVDSAGGQRMPLAFVFVTSGLQQLDETRLEQHLTGASAQRQRISRAQEVPTQVAEQVQRRDVGAV